MKTAFASVLAGITLSVTVLAALPAYAIPAPMGAQIFCINNVEHCRPDAIKQVSATDQLIATLNSVNRQVNSSMRYVADRGALDNWKVGGSTGDCEDYALTKRSKLIRMGVPAGALRMAATYTRRGEPHAVLIVRTDRGDLVLDNLSARVLPRASTGYRIVKMASNDPRVWQ